MKNEKECINCCNSTNKNGILRGIGFGLIPHIGCIAFILFSVIGMSAFASIFKPLLYKAYFFYLMIGASLLFSTLSAFFYLKNKGGIKAAKHHKKYLSILYGSTIGVGIIFYFFIFPLVGAYTASSGEIINTNENLTLRVGIPCEGHAPLISSELKKLNGIGAVTYVGSFKFQINYDSNKIGKQEILNASIFEEYPAKEI